MLLYYSYTGQSLRVLEAAGEVFRERGCDVHKAEIEFTDPRFAERFSRFPMRRVWPDMLSVLPAQKRGATGEIRTPDTVRNGDYDLICIGSPTWWQTVSMPMRSFLKSDEARKLLAGKPFAVFVVCRQYWRENFTAVRELGEQQGGRVRRRNPFHVSRRPASLDAVADQLPGVGSVPRPVPGRAHSANQRPAGAAGADARRSRPASRIGCSARDRRTGQGSGVGAMPRSFDVSFESPASVEQVHSAFSDEDYWLARFAAFGGDNTLDSLIVDSDGTVTVTVTQDLRQRAARLIAKFVSAAT